MLGGIVAGNEAPRPVADVFTTFEGDNTVLLHLVAKSLLSGYARQFGDLNLLGLARYLAGRASDSIAERMRW